MANRTAPQVGVAITRAASMQREPDRRVRFVASDESVDRYGDIIRASG